MDFFKENRSFFNTFFSFLCGISLVSPIVSLYAEQPANEIQTTENTSDDLTKGLSDTLVIGSRGLAYAIVNELIQQKKAVTIFAWDKEKTAALFNYNPLITIIEGAVETDIDLLRRAVAGKKQIFVCPYFPYRLWEQNLIATLHNLITVTDQSNVQLIFPSHIVRVGNVHYPVPDTLIVEPCSKQGKILQQAEDLLEKAALASKNRKIIVLRHGNLFGPNIFDGLASRAIQNALQRQPLSWVDDTSKGWQWAYSRNVATTMLHLTQRDDLPSFSIFHYGGTLVDSIESWLKLIAHLTNSPAQIAIDSRMKVWLLSSFQAAAEACYDIMYLFNNQVALQNSTLIEEFFTHHHQISMRDALIETIEWFSKNKQS